MNRLVFDPLPLRKHLRGPAVIDISRGDVVQRVVDRVSLKTFLLGCATPKTAPSCWVFTPDQVRGSESEACWWGFVADPKARVLGRSSPEVIASDSATGLVKAVTALFPRVKHQHCMFHKAMDFGTHVAHQRRRSRIIADALNVFAGATQREVRERIRAVADRWSATEPRAIRNFLRGIEDCLTHLEHPDPCPGLDSE